MSKWWCAIGGKPASFNLFSEPRGMLCPLRIVLQPVSSKPHGSGVLAQQRFPAQIFTQMKYGMGAGP